MIKYLVMDVDGTLTDGKIYMGPNGEAMKAFSIKDGMVINYILKPAGIVPVVITARTSQIVKNRCDELGIKEVYQGKLDKLAALKEIVGEDKLGECAYFGDDILDLKCMQPIAEEGGIIACPADAVQEVKAKVDYVCVNRAGEGALREFAEWLVSEKVNEDKVNQRVERAVEFLKQLKVGENDVGQRIEVDEDFFYSVQSYETKPTEDCKLESHRKYIDIQLMISGREKMDLADITRLSIKEQYDEDKDIIFWKTPKRLNSTTLVAGDCIILYPEMAHRGAQNDKTTDKVLKIVGKVRI